MQKTSGLPLPRFRVRDAMALAAVVAAVGCRSERVPARAATSAAAESGAASVEPVRPATSHPPADTIRNYRMTWSAAAVADRLRSDGLAVEDAGPVRQPFMNVEGRLLRVDAGVAEVQVYVYGDAAARGRDSDPLDTARVAPPTAMVTWRARPSLVTANNLAAIVLTGDEPLRRRITSALRAPHGGAGAAPADRARP